MHGVKRRNAQTLLLARLPSPSGPLGVNECYGDVTPSIVRCTIFAMENRSNLSITALFILAACLLVPAQSKRVKYQLTQFDNAGCEAKGRVQDCNGKVIQQILADGKDAIPILISQLTETTRTKKEITDYWADTRSGDVAYVVLTDLFTKPDEETSQMPDVPDWKTLMDDCHSPAQGCWDKYVRKHGRISVQRAWLRAWNLHKDQVYWDSKAWCFRVAKD